MNGLDVILMVIGFIGLLVIGLPIPYALLLPSAIYIIVDPRLDLFLMANSVTNTMLSFPLIAIPLYLLVAEAMTESEAAQDLFDFLEMLMRHVRGGLAHANIAINLIFAGMSGSYTADLIGLGKLELPAMIRRGFSKELSVGLTGAAACLGPIFPPSIFMILYAMIVGESVGRLFLGGIIPAFVMCGFLSATIILWPNKAAFPPVSESRAAFVELWPAFRRTLPAMFTPVLILGAIASGAATATEAAAIALAYTLFLWAAFYRSMTLKKLFGVFLRTAKFCAAVFFMVGAASVFAWLLTLEQLPNHLPILVQSITSNSTFALLLIVIFVLFLGCFLDGIAIILIVTPFLVPSIRTYGIDPVHFGVVMTLAVSMGALTPPYGLAIYALAEIAELDVHSTIRGLLRFTLPLFLTLLVLIVFPSIVTFIPNYIFR